MIKPVGNELYVYLPRNAKTIRIMDEFERIDDQGNPLYERLIIMDAIPKDDAYVDLIVEKERSRFGVGGDTMTELLNSSAWRLYKYVDDYITTIDVNNIIDTNDICLFDTPYILKAANSSDRTGYGSRWEHSNGESYQVYKGTEYGQTTKYLIVGIRLYKSPYWERIDFSDE